jgi:hypothetical protein
VSRPPEAAPDLDIHDPPGGRPVRERAGWPLAGRDG